MGAERFARAAMAGIALTCILGCGDMQQGQGRNDWVTVGPGSRQGDVSVFRDVQFADIPVPQEYVIVPGESSSFQGSLFRNAMMVYHGPLDWVNALEFYRTQLPQAGWRFEKMERGYDFRVLYFSKAQEKLIVIVRQIRNGSRTELQLDNVDKNDLLLKGKLNEPKY